jgi:hypothetical protein
VQIFDILLINMRVANTSGRAHLYCPPSLPSGPFAGDEVSVDEKKKGRAKETLRESSPVRRERRGRERGFDSIHFQRKGVARVVKQQRAARWA